MILVFGPPGPVWRMLCRMTALASFVCGMAPRCIAGKFHQQKAVGVYLTHYSQVLQSLSRNAPGTYWIDGYRMAISSDTLICWHDAPPPFGPTLDRDGQSIPRLKATSPCGAAQPGPQLQSAWLQYLAVQKYRNDSRFTTELNVVASRVDVWRSAEEASQMPTARAQTWRTLCAAPVLHQLRYAEEDPIDVVCDARINSYVERVFLSLLKPTAVTPDGPGVRQETPSFYVVQPFEVMHNYDFESIDGSGVRCGMEGSLCTYQHPHAHSTVHEIVYAPDGTVLIADTALAHLTNEAQLAALLSYSLVATDQDLIARLFRAQHYMGGVWSSSGRRNGIWIPQLIAHLNQQTLRLGIEQMYQAGYDIRYAPFAWAVAQGKCIKNPGVDAGKNMPFDALYAFNAIDQLYPDTDYSKLKLGEAEYRQFLQELYKADPDAFKDQEQPSP